MPQKRKPEVPRFKRGDTVKILRKAKTHERGWQNCWMEAMDATVDRRGVVLNGEIAGFRHDVSINVDGVGTWGYPDFVLKLVKAKK